MQKLLEIRTTKTRNVVLVFLKIKVKQLILCLNLLNKTVKLLFILCNFAIVPFMGTGIKIGTLRQTHATGQSYPSWVRGLKVYQERDMDMWECVVPFAGTGIKM